MSTRIQFKAIPCSIPLTPVPTRLLQRTDTSSCATGPALEHAEKQHTALVLQRKPLGHDFSNVRAHVDVSRSRHPKLAISHPGDKREQEADRVADQVMRMPEPYRQRRAAPEEEKEMPQSKPLVQRRKESKGEEEDEKPFQTKPMIQRRGDDGSAGTPTKIPASVHDVLLSPGQPLDPAARAFMEPRFGHDFSQVRVHTDAKAAESARVVKSLAFTLGRNIVFGAGRYSPQTATGRRLLAHELTHVVQQHFGKSDKTIQRTPSVASWVFNTGEISDDNCCKSCTYTKLGVDSEFYPNRSGMYPGLQNSKTNGMELQAFISNHAPGVTYDIKRVIERNIWERQGPAAPWTAVPNQYKPPGTDDDPDNADECLTPIPYPHLPRHYIYVIDHPGLNVDLLGSTSTEAIYKASFTESVEITDTGNATADSKTYDWHSITRVTKQSNGTWATNKTDSEIESGSITVGTAGP